MMTNEQILQERQLIQQCQAGDETAWARLVADYGACVRRCVRKCLGHEARHRDLVDDNVAEVWASLGYHHGRRLQGYDPQRGCLATLLSARAWQVVQMDRKRRSHHLSATASLHRILEEGPVDGRAVALIAERLLEEFLATLTRREVVYFWVYLLGALDIRVLPPAVPACIRKRIQVLRRKLRVFLCG